MLSAMVMAVVAMGDPHAMIDKLRKSDIHISVVRQRRSAETEEPVQIRVRQVNRSFPFGTAVNAYKYNDRNTPQCYRDFIHQHFNWAVPENAQKWPSIEPTQGHANYQPALDAIHALRSHGIKMRCHNLVWSVDSNVQGWVKQLQGTQLKQVVEHHIQDTMGHFRGLCEHWDVNNENLHGQWYQTQLHENDYNLELFRIAHRTDAQPKLFLNDYNVVAGGWSTNDYLHQGQWFKQNNVGLYGMGCQCHFGSEEDPNPASIKHNLDILSQVGVPLWATELDVQAADEHRRATFYEHALTALFAHPHVEGIMLWGFWDQAHWRGRAASLVEGNNCHINAAGQKVIELITKRWQSDEVVTLTDESEYTVRGFHGEYELEIIHKGKTLEHLKKNFSLGKSALNVTVHI